MKNRLLICLMVIFLSLPIASQAETLADRLKGRILLQVQTNGEAWYVNPENGERYYMGRPADAFQLMRNLGLGVSSVDFQKFGEYAPVRLAGRILLKVEDKGQAYYVNPIDLKMHYLGRPDDAFNVMRELGLGITNENLNTVKVRAGYNIETAVVAEEIPVVVPEAPVVPEVQEPAEDITEVATTSPVIATSTEEVAKTCDFTAEYFKNTSLLGYPLLTQIETGINHEWWTGKPEGFNYNNEFSVRWTGACDFTSGKYKFTGVFDDGMRVYIDDQIIIDSWDKAFDVKTESAEQILTEGKHMIIVEYFEYSLNASVNFGWEKI